MSRWILTFAVGKREVLEAACRNVSVPLVAAELLEAAHAGPANPLIAWLAILMDGWSPPHHIVEDQIVAQWPDIAERWRGLLSDGKLWVGSDDWRTGGKNLRVDEDAVIGPSEFGVSAFMSHFVATMQFSDATRLPGLVTAVVIGPTIDDCEFGD